MVENPDRVRRLGETARVKARSTFTWERKAEVLAAVMNYAIRAQPRPALAPKQELLSQYHSVAIQ